MINSKRKNHKFRVIKSRVSRVKREILFFIILDVTVFVI